jgi:hypothetical protein
MKSVKDVILAVAAIVLVVGVVYGVWAVSTLIKYKMSYQDLVVETIREQVKPECLK